MKGAPRVNARLGRARRATWKELLVRFAFGGTITATAGLLSETFGPTIGGLFLAFPAILPASLTLIERHTDGTTEAGTSARGAAYGAVGLMLFGAIVWRLGQTAPAWLILAAATLAWLAGAVILWRLLDSHWRSRRRSGPDRQLPCPSVEPTSHS